MNKRVFYYHYNKPQSQKMGKPQISLHYNKTCYIVDNIVCNVPTFGYLKKTQPRFVVKGKGIVNFKDGIAYVN